MKRKIKAFQDLTRFHDYAYIVITATVLGAAASKGTTDIRFLVLLAANCLSAGFGIVIRQIEDAPEDALVNHRNNRNPIAAGLISPKTAKTIAYLLGLMAVIFYLILGIKPIYFGMLILISGFLHAIRGIRLKDIPIVDILVRSLIFTGFQYLTSYFTYAQELNRNWFWPLAFLFTTNIFYLLYKESHKDQENLRFNQKPTSNYLGNRGSQITMIIFLSFSVISGFISFLVINIIPYWVLLLMMALIFLLLISPTKDNEKGKKTKSFLGAILKPLEKSAAISLILGQILPWLDRLLGFGIFS